MQEKIAEWDRWKKRTVRYYNTGQKRLAVSIAESLEAKGTPNVDIAKRLGVTPGTLRNWKSEFPAEETFRETGRCA